MTYMLYFHRSVFACALVTAFMLGAADRVRGQMLRESYSPEYLTLLSLSQLSNLEVL